MKAKSLFLVFALSLLLPFAAKAVDVVDEYCAPTGYYDAEIYIPSLAGESGVRYTVNVGYDISTECVIFDEEHLVATKLVPDGATVQSINITWDDSETFNEDGESAIFVYGRNDDAFTGEETKEELDDAAVSMIGHAYYSAPGTESITLDSHTRYIAIIGGGVQAAISCVEITWDVPAVTKFTLSSSITGTGFVTFTPASPVEAGTSVKVTFAGSKSELHNYTITGSSTIESKAFSADEYTSSYSTTFTMPSHNVTVAATFEATPSRTTNLIRVNGKAATYSTTIPSGIDSIYTISLKLNSESTPAYTAGIKSISSQNGRVVIVNNGVNPSTGVGDITLRGMIPGSDVIEITTYQTDKCKSATRKINVTVVSREVALVTELNGKYYAVTHDLDGATIAAVKLIKQGDKYYYKPGVSKSDITWYFAAAKADNTKFFIRNSADKYLTVDAASVSLESESFQWSKNASGLLITGYLTGLCYDEEFTAFTVAGQNDHRGVSSISAPVYEVNASNIGESTLYTRTLKNGFFSTICLPYPVSRTDADFFGGGIVAYTIVSKVVETRVKSIELEEVEGALVAGTPYIVMASATTLNIWHGDATVEDPVNDPTKGLFGNLDPTLITVADGCYGIKDNELRLVDGGTGLCPQYRAYINLDDVPNTEEGVAPSPKRVTLYAAPETPEENPDDPGQQTPTSLEEFLEHASYIDWSQPVYNSLGQRVGKGATGVLIQDGRKVLVQ